MEYFTENVYEIIGRYSCTAIIDFSSDSEEYGLYGSYVSGKFLYSNRERTEAFKRISDVQNPSKTHGKLRFKPNDKSVFSDEQLLKLRRDGISTESIMELGYIYPFNPVDPHSAEGIKEIPNVINIDIDKGTPQETIVLINSLNKRFYESGWDLINEEIAELISTEEHYSDNIGEELRKNFEVYNSPLLKERIKVNFLEQKSWIVNGDLSDEETLDLVKLKAKQFKRTYDCFCDELSNIHGDPDQFLTENSELKKAISTQCYNFKPERLVIKDPAIWWDEKSFAHIIFRHAMEFNNTADDRGKTRFQYEINNTIRLIKNVCKTIHTEFKEYKGKIFYLQGKRAVEYNGNHYCLRILKEDGLLTQFHPYEKEA
jgi:hypothetical protein